MPLTIYFSDEPLPTELSVIHNVEASFIKPAYPLPKAFIEILLEVEQATPSMSNPESFRDRFGRDLYWEFLSTGCKAAYLVLTRPQCVNTLECGYNALKAIIGKCNTGSIIMQWPTFSIPFAPIDVVLHQRHFVNGMELDKYIHRECL